MKKYIIFIITGLTIYSCSPSTVVTGSWKSPTESIKNFDHIVIAALTDNINAKSIVENDLAAKLRETGLTVSTSIDLFPPNFSEEHNDRQTLLDKMHNVDADAILTLSLIDEATETRYVPGNYAYRPYPRYQFYGRFWVYYSYRYPQIYEPGYYEQNKIYYIEANLYDAISEKLIWSAQSETYNPSNLYKFSKEFANVISNKMKADKVLM